MFNPKTPLTVRRYGKSWDKASMPYSTRREAQHYKEEAYRGVGVSKLSKDVHKYIVVQHNGKFFLYYREAKKPKR